MTLAFNRLTQAVQEMGQHLAQQERAWGRLVEQARAWLGESAGEGLALQEAASQVGAAIPTWEPLDTAIPYLPPPERFTVIGADGTVIQPDRHGMALYYLINVGSLVYRHGSGQTPRAHSIPRLCFREEDLYEGPLLVTGNLLDVQRDQAEIEHLADLAETERQGGAEPVLALVDGTLILWVLENLPTPGRREKVLGYLRQLERIRRTGAAVAAFISRPRHTEVGHLLHLASVKGVVQQAQAEPNPLEHLPDRAIFGFLPPGARSALFISPSPINKTYYAPEGHEVCFFYVNVAEVGEPIVARVEVPIWVMEGSLEGGPSGLSPLSFVHRAVVAQCRIAGGFPYVLVRADELAYVSGAERERLEEMVGTALLATGLAAAPSPKAFYKTLTRGRR